MCAKIKFLIVCFLVPIVALGFVGCSINIDFGRMTDRPQMDRVANTIVKAIQENDSDMIKQLFSKGVRDNVGDEEIMKGVEYLHTFLEGDIVSCEYFSWVIDTTNRNWKTRRALHCMYKVTTTIDTYTIRFIYNRTDAITPDFKGMFNLWISRDLEEFHGVVRSEFMGIYVPLTIDEAERNIPHEYKTNYGTFTVPAGYYKDDSLSTDDKYYFTVEGIIMSDVKYNHFSITSDSSEYSLNETKSFEDFVLADLRDKLNKKNDPYDTFYSSDTVIEEIFQGKTTKGYPLLEYSFVEANTPDEIFFYILGEKKYVVVQYSYTSGMRSSERSKEEKAMIAAAESLVDSFVWAE